MKKRLLIYLSIVVVLSIVLVIVSRISAGFSEWYAVTIYPIWVGTIGRFFGIFSFSISEILIILIILAGLSGVVLFIIKMFKSKGRRKTILAKSGLALALVSSTGFLIFMLNCGINYNRQTFLYDQEVEFERNVLDEWMVFLTLLDEFYEDFPDIGTAITTDDDGVFMMTTNLKTAAPAAMKKLSEEYPRLSVYFPPPNSTIFPGLMSDAFLLGYFSPFTIEAQYNGIAPDTEKAITALHELVHVSGFMREEEANFISFLAAKKSDDPELRYAAFVNVFYSIKYTLDLMSEELYNELPNNFKKLFDRFTKEAGVELGCYYDELEDYYRLEVWAGELLPEQVQRDLSAQSDFWWDRYWDTSYVFDDDGEVIDVIIEANPIVEVISDASSTVNDTYLKLQGQEDGIMSYDRMIDLVMAVYLAGME